MQQRDGFERISNPHQRADDQVGDAQYESALKLSIGLEML